MGAWGVASFENDDALDLVGDFHDEGWTVISTAISAAGGADYVEAPVAARAIAAAEVVTAVLGHGRIDIPQIEFPEPALASSQVERLRDLALTSLRRVRDRATSELHGLWDEAGQLDEWERTLVDLEHRLQAPPRASGPIARRPRRTRLIEGSCYAIPLPSGGFGLGLLTHLIAGKLPFGYFFGPRRSEPPRETDLAQLRPGIAILRVKFGLTEIDNGRWRLVGQIPSWNPIDWPTPPVTGGLAGGGMVWLLEHPRDAPTDNPGQVTKISLEEAKGLEADIVTGALALEKMLDRQL